MKASPFLLAICISSTIYFACSKADKSDEREILALEAEIADLTRRNDCKAMAAYIKRVFADDYLVTTSTGIIHDKSAVLVNLTSHKEIDPLQANETYRHDDLKVRIYEQAAIVTGKQVWRSHAQANVKAAFREQCFTHFYVKREGSWKLAAVQATPFSYELAQK